MDRNIRVIISDDHKIFRDAIVTMLGSCLKMDIVAICNNGESVIEAVKSHSPDIVLIDIHMGVMNGIEATNIIKTNNTQTRVLIYSIDDSEFMQRQARQAGADGFISKNRPIGELCQTINTILKGDTWFAG